MYSTNSYIYILTTAYTIQLHHSLSYINCPLQDYNTHWNSNRPLLQLYYGYIDL